MTEKINLLSPEFRAHPYPVYARLRKEPGLLQVDPGGLWAVARYDDVQYVLKNPKLFSASAIRLKANPPWLEGLGNPLAESMLSMDPPQHTRLRALVGPAFTPKAIARLEPLIREVSSTLAQSLGRQEEVDFVQAFAMPLPAFVIGELLGLAPEMRPRLKQWSDDIVSIPATPMSATERITHLRGMISELRTYLLEVIEQRRRQPRDDMMSDLLAAEVEGKRLTENELIAFGTLLLVGGLETTTHLLSHLIVKLSENPALHAQVRAQTALVPKLVEEVLRLEPPLQLTYRLVTTEVELSGVTLPANALIAVMLSSANRDERYFERADDIVLDRQSQPLLSFGHGAHFCLGAPLARMEARIGMEELLSRYKTFERTSATLRWNHSLGLRGPRELPIRAMSS